jgi:hypothetical protein
VLVQVGLEGEGLVAALAVVVLESGMGLHVSSGRKKRTILKIDGSESNNDRNSSFKKAVQSLFRQVYSVNSYMLLEINAH